MFGFWRKKQTPATPPRPQAPEVRIVAPGDQVYLVTPMVPNTKGYIIQLGYVDRIEYGPGRRPEYFVTPLCEDHPFALDATMICAREDRDGLQVLLEKETPARNRGHDNCYKRKET